MYFEARSHQIIEVADAAAAVRMVHEGKAAEFQCPTWLNAAGQRVALVSDTHIDDANFGECAVVNLDTKKQLESITFAWCKGGEQEKLRYVLGCENAPGTGTNVIVPCTDADRDVKARFTCSCCGERFLSTLREQLPHDQDAGYGHCPACFPSAIPEPAAA